MVCVSLGLHWAVLQGVAWTGMLIRNLQSEGVIEAVEKTFDGGHPCPLCRVVKKGQQEEEKKDSVPVASKTLKKFEAVLAATMPPLMPSFEIRSFPESVSRFEGRHERPLAPPPRGAEAIIPAIL